VYLPSRRLIAEYRYVPAKRPAHVGPDHPDYPASNAGARAVIRILHLYDELHIEQTVSPQHLSAISEAIREGWLRGSAPARVEVKPAASSAFDHTEGRRTDSPDQYVMEMKEEA
jgi:hypothetical protein